MRSQVARGVFERLAEYGWRPHRIGVARANLLEASIYRCKHNKQGSTVSSNSRSETALLQQYSASLSVCTDVRSAVVRLVRRQPLLLVADSCALGPGLFFPRFRSLNCRLSTSISDFKLCMIDSDFWLSPPDGVSPVRTLQAPRAKTARVGSPVAESLRVGEGPRG